VQTGCDGFSDDILIHRKIMGAELIPEDRLGLTCPYVFPFPGSPHLAAEIAGQMVDLGRVEAATHELAQRYDVVLVEGVGGLCVPLTAETTALDFLVRHGWPVVLVTAPRLGSINHTILSLEALHIRRISLAGVIYNLRHTARPEIVRDTRDVIETAMRSMGYAAPIIDIPEMGADGTVGVGFSGLPLPSGHDDITRC
jgi:dethiobiotin synthetase